MNKSSKENWNDDEFGEEFESDTNLVARLIEIDEIDDDEFDHREEVRRFANLTRTYDA